MNVEVLGDRRVEVDVLGAAPLAATNGSGQMPAATSSSWVGAKTIAPKYDPVAWADLLNRSVRLRRSIYAMARNTVGLGYDVVPVRTDVSEAEHAAAMREVDFAERRLAEPNQNLESFSAILEQFKIDMETTGDGWLEVTEDRLGRSAGIYHAPARVMRYAGDGQVLVQTRGTKTAYFRRFGDTRSVDPATGLEAPGLAWNERATTVLHLRVYAPDDEWYGAPRHVPAALAVNNVVAASEWNAGLLKNAVLPSHAVVLENGNLSPEARNSLTNLFAERRGSDAAGRWLLLEPNMQGISPAMQGGTKIRVDPIGGAPEGAFSALSTAANEEIRESVGVPNIMLGAFDGANRASAVIALRITVQQELEPEIQRIEYTITRGILRTMGLRRVRFQLRRPRILDSLQEANLVQKLMTCLSVNDMRKVLSDLRCKPLPPMDHPLADRPLAFLRDASMTQVAEGLASGISRASAELAAAPGDVSTVASDDDVADNVVRLPNRT